MRWKNGNKIFEIYLFLIHIVHIEKTPFHSDDKNRQDNHALYKYERQAPTTPLPLS